MNTNHLLITVELIYNKVNKIKSRCNRSRMHAVLGGYAFKE